MKKILLLLFVLLAGKGIAQTNLINSGGSKIVIISGTNLKADHVRNNGAIINNGDLYLKGNFNQTNSATYTGSASSWLRFGGTSTQTINSDVSPLVIARLKVENTAGVQLAQNLSISKDLNLTTGDLDLNGKNVDLGATGILTEDHDNNHLVKDLTATNETNQGGAINFIGTVTNTTTEIKGTGLYLQRTAGSDYAVTVTRRCYNATSNNLYGKGIRRIYRIVGTPTGTNTKMRIYYATDETVGITGTYRMFRWQNVTGWLQATDGGSGFTNGTNGTNYAEATNINAFSDWTIGASEKPLAIDTLNIGKTIEVYPNPNNGTFTISGVETRHALSLSARLLNAQGTVVATSVATAQNGETTKFVTTGLPAGVYFLHTTVAGKTKITKVVIM